MNTKRNTAIEASEARELHNAELDVVSGAGLHFTIFGMDVDVTADAVCVSTSNAGTCKWRDGSVDRWTTERP
jgi:hypothetical protein